MPKPLRTMRVGVYLHRVGLCSPAMLSLFEGLGSLAPPEYDRRAEPKEGWGEIAPPENPTEPKKKGPFVPEPLASLPLPDVPRACPGRGQEVKVADLQPAAFVFV